MIAKKWKSDLKIAWPWQYEHSLYHQTTSDFLIVDKIEFYMHKNSDKIKIVTTLDVFIFNTQKKNDNMVCNVKV